MKISELIEKLEEIKANKGDIELVLLSNYNAESPCSFVSLDLITVTRVTEFYDYFKSKIRRNKNKEVVFIR